MMTYQGCYGWRAWWKWHAPTLLGWAISSPISVTMFWPDWRWVVGVIAGQLIVTLIVTQCARLLGAGPYNSD